MKLNNLNVFDAFRQRMTSRR